MCLKRFLNGFLKTRDTVTKKKDNWRHMLTAIILLVGVTNIFAADRVILGDTMGIPLAVSANSDTVQTLNVLRQQAAKNGVARVIVGVRAAFAPEGLMSASDAALQRNEIAGVHSAVLNKVPSLKQKSEKIKRFATIPFMAIEADPSELEALANLSEITSIAEDRLAAPTLAESVPLIGGVAAWSSGYTGTGQTVAILDTGVDKTHPFLVGKVVSEACYSTNYASQSATSVCPGGVTSSTAAGSAMPYSGACPTGECDHGTHVAGIAAGKGSSFSGVAKDASLIAIQVFSRFDSATECGSASATPCVLTYTSDQILGLQRVYALRNTYSIASVNMSLGGGQYFSQSSCDSDNANVSIKAAIDNLRAVNIATVISSGNNGYVDSMGAPGCISSAVSIGATYDAAGYVNNCDGNNLGTSSLDQIACYSNSVSFLNLLAPGSLITSSIPGGGYANYQGTSMAAPHVAGAWALLKQKKAALTVTEGLNVLISTGVSVTDPRNSIVKPRIQIDTALAALSGQCAYTISPTSQTFTSTGGTGSVTVTASGSSCAWTATSALSWVTITTGSGTGSGTAGFSVSANTAGVGQRTGNITIAGQTFAITQNSNGSTTTTNLLLNPGFESGNVNWTATTSAIKNDSTHANTGSWYAWLGGFYSSTTYIYQDVTIPSDAQQSYLQFWYYIATAETTTSIAYDTMAVEIRRPADNTLLATLVTLSNLNKTSGYVQSQQYDLSAFKGQTIRLRFMAITDAYLNTNFRIDDISLSSTSAPSCTYTIAPTSQSFTSAAGTGSASVTASASSCSWTASSSLGWATITSGSGTGSGTVTISVAANTTGATRTGNITIAGQTFVITQSDTVFADVASSNGFYSYINAIYNAGITLGCAQNPLMYCPDASVTRGQMAAFIIRAKYGETFTYTSTPYFSDVPATNGFFKYVQRLKDDAITVVTGTYGVNDVVTRGQMAAFIIRALYGETFTYTSTPYFSDVPATNGFFKYVQRLKDDAITVVTGTYGINDVVTRGQMAAFIARAFLGMP